MAAQNPMMSKAAGGHRKITAGMLLFYALVALASLEFGLRAFWLKKLVLGQGIEHPHFHHRLKPSSLETFASDEFNVTTTTNSYGLRGKDPVLPKPAGIKRILMLGDSYTFGFPVKDEETFSALAEKALQAKGLSVDVVNGGVSGYSPTLHFISLRDQFLDFQPDAVILWYDLGDLMEDHWFQKNLLLDAQGNIVRCDPNYINGRFSMKHWILNHSAIAIYTNNKIIRTWEKAKILGPWNYLKMALRGERAKAAIAKIKREQKAADLAENDKFLLVRPESTPESLEPYWQLSRKYLLMIRDLLRERHIPLLIGVYPYGMVVAENQWDEGRTAWGFEKGNVYSADAFLTLMRQFCESNAIPLIDTFGDFKQAATTETLFYRWDGHFTPAGHRIVAQRLAQNPALLQVAGQ